jgi:hypothetical protein
MRLSDKQYNVLVRAGILVVIVAVFAFDKTPPTYHPFIMAIATVGAILGFFPFFTSLPFQSNKEGESRTAELEVYNCDEMLDVKPRKDSINLDIALESLPQPYTDDAHVYSQLLEAYIQNVCSYLRPNLTVPKQYLHICDVDSASLNLRSYMTSTFANPDERSARVKEVCDLVNKLKGTPETYTVELTSSNSIIVHREGKSQSSIIMDQYEKQMQDFDKSTDTPVTSIQ